MTYENKDTEYLEAEKWLLELCIKEAEESTIIPPDKNPQLPYMRESLESINKTLKERGVDDTD